MAAPFYDDLPLPTGLATAPLAPRRKLRDGRDGASARTSSRGSSSSSAGARGGSMSRPGSRGSSAAASRRGTPTLGQSQASGSGTASSSAAGAVPRRRSNVEVVLTSRPRGCASASPVKTNEPLDPVQSISNSRGGSGSGNDMDIEPEFDFIADHEAQTGAAGALPRASTHQADPGPSIAAHRSSSRSRARDGHSSVNEDPSVPPSEMDFMRAHGWEVRPEPRLPYASGPSDRGMEEDGDRSHILAADRPRESRLAAATSFGGSMDMAAAAAAEEEEEDDHETEEWFRQRRAAARERREALERLESPEHDGRGRGRGQSTSPARGRARAQFPNPHIAARHIPSPALSAMSADAGHGSRSPSPMLPLPLGISARAMMGGLGRIAAEEAEMGVQGQEVQGERGVDGVGSGAGVAEGEGMEVDGGNGDGNDGIEEIAPEHRRVGNPRESATTATAAGPAGTAELFPGSDNAPRGLARPGGLTIFDRLDGRTEPDPNNNAESAARAQQEGGNGPQRPPAAPTAESSSSGSVVLLDTPPSRLSRPGRTHNATSGEADGVAYDQRQMQADDRGVGSSSSAQSQSSALSNIDADADGEGNSDTDPNETGRRYTREEKGKGRAEPSARGRRASHTQTRTAQHAPKGTRARVFVLASEEPMEVDGEGDESELTDIASDGHEGVEMEMGRRARGDESVQWIEPPSPSSQGRTKEGAVEGQRRRELEEDGEYGPAGDCVYDFVYVKEEEGVEDIGERGEMDEVDALEGIDAFVCPICLDPPSKPVMALCGHVHCHACFHNTLLHNIKSAPNPYPGQPIPSTPANRGRRGGMAGRSGAARAGAAGARGGGPGRGAKRTSTSTSTLPDPSIPLPNARENQPTQWTAAGLMQVMRTSKMDRDLRGYREAGMSEGDARAALGAVWGEEAVLAAGMGAEGAAAAAGGGGGGGGGGLNAANGGDVGVEGVKELLRGLWKVEGGYVLEGECPFCRAPLPGGMGPFDSGVGSVIPLGAIQVHRSMPSRRSAKRGVKA